MLTLLIALFVSCNGSSDNSKSNTTEITIETSEEEPLELGMLAEEEEEDMITPVEQAPTYYNLVGKVAGADVHMSMELDNGNVMGRYYYDSQSKKASSSSMKFYGEYNGAHMIFTEFYSEKPTGTFDGYWADESFKGTFTRSKDGKTFDFSLTSVYADIFPGGGEAFFEEFDDFFFEIPGYNQSGFVSQGQMAVQQPTEEDAIKYIDENAINFYTMCSDYANPIKAEKKYPFEKEMLLRIRIDKINYSYGNYTYKIKYEGLANEAYIFTNDKAFEELDYPQVVWIKTKYHTRYTLFGINTYEFTDAELLLWRAPSFGEW